MGSSRGSSLTGRVALITGVSRRLGIGAAIAQALAEAGADIFTTYFRQFDAAQPYGSDAGEAEEVLDGVRGLGVRAAGMEADLSDPQVPAAIMSRAWETLGHVDILVNNAAHAAQAELYTVTAAALDQHYAVNVRGPLLLCQAFARQHDGRPGGRIINLTSGQTLTPMPGEIPYAATKSALEGLTLSLSRALAPKGITVNAIDPGATDTGWISETLRDELLREAPFGRLGTPADVAHLVRFLASHEGQWVTGQVIRSRGGM